MSAIFYSYIFSFVHKLLTAVRMRKAQPRQQSLYEGTAKFSVFLVVSSSDPDKQAAETGSGLEACLQVYYYFAEFTAAHSPHGCFALTQMGNATAAELTDQFINMSLTYLYRKSSAEVIKFNSRKTVEKISVVQVRILFSKSRILDGIAFAAEMGDLELTDLPAMGAKPHVPVIDGLTRLGCEVGLPSILLIDQDSTLPDFLLLSAFWDALPLVRAYTGMCAIPCH